MSSLDELRSALEGLSAIVAAPQHAKPGEHVSVSATFPDGWLRDADEAEAVVYELGWTFVEAPDKKVVVLSQGMGVQVRFTLVVPPEGAGESAGR